MADCKNQIKMPYSFDCYRHHCLRIKNFCLTHDPPSKFPSFLNAKLEAGGEKLKKSDAQHVETQMDDNNLQFDDAGQQTKILSKKKQQSTVENATLVAEQEKKDEQANFNENQKTPCMKKNPTKFDKKKGAGASNSGQCLPPREYVQRGFAQDQRHRLPPYGIFGKRRSLLTLKQQEIHVASILNFAHFHKYTGSGGKEHDFRKKHIKVEQDTYQQIVKNHAMQNWTGFMKRYRIPYKIFLLNKEHFNKKLALFNKCPMVYHFSMSVDCRTLDSKQVPLLEYDQLLLETGKLPKMVVPNIEKRCIVEPDDMGERDLDLKASVMLLDDSNVKPLMEKHMPNFVLNFSAAKTLLSGFGPLGITDWIIPVFVSNSFIQGRKMRVIYLLKPLPVKSLDSVQLNYLRYKKALLFSMVYNQMQRDEKLTRKMTKSSCHEKATFNNNDDLFGTTVDVESAETFGSDTWLNSKTQQNIMKLAPSSQLQLHDNICTVSIDSVNQDLSSKCVDDDNTSVVKKRKIIKDSCITQPDQSILQITESAQNKMVGVELSPKNGPRLPPLSLTDPRRVSFSPFHVRTTIADNIEPDLVISDEPEPEPDPDSDTDPVSSRLSASRRTTTSDSDVLAKIFKERVVKRQSKHLETRQRVVSNFDEKMNPKTKAYVVDADETPTEKLIDYTGTKSDEKLLQYSMWRLGDYRLMIRSNLHGSIKAQYQSDFRYEKWSKSTVLPQIEYQWEYGAQQMDDKDFLNHYWTAFLKRSFIHLRARMSPMTSDMLALDVLRSDQFLRVDYLSNHLQTSVGNGINRLSKVLTELYEMDSDGWFLLKPDKMEGNDKVQVFRSLSTRKSPTVCSTEEMIDLAQIYDDHWLRQLKMCDLGEFDDVWRPLDPNGVLQWHKILKRAPCTFPPRQPEEKPLFENYSGCTDDDMQEINRQVKNNNNNNNNKGQQRRRSSKNDASHQKIQSKKTQNRKRKRSKD